MLLKLDFFQDAFYGCVRYLNIKILEEIFKFNIKNTAQKVMTNFDFGRRFHDLKYFEVGTFFMFIEFIINLRAPIQK